MLGRGWGQRFLVWDAIPTFFVGISLHELEKNPFGTN